MTRLLIAGAALWTVAIGQERPTFRAEANTVYIYATVQRNDGRLVTDLTRDDFEVFDNNRPQPITVFDNTPQRITVAVMFDMSRSMAGQYPRIRDAAVALVQALWPDDRARIGSFGMEVAISPLLTNDKPTLLRIIDEELWPGKNTPLWYGTEMAMKALEDEPGRRVVLLFTDGVDSTLLVPGNQGRTREMAERGAFMIYAVGLGGLFGGMSDEMKLFVAATGGGHFVVPKEDDLGKTFAQVVEELHHQYVIGFSPETLDGKSHKLTIKTRQPGMKVRGRKTYIAGKEPGAP
jgi:Ca-activated chloride channel family protein